MLGFFSIRPLSEIGTAVLVPMLSIPDLVNLRETCRLLAHNKVIADRIDLLIERHTWKFPYERLMLWCTHYTKHHFSTKDRYLWTERIRQSGHGRILVFRAHDRVFQNIFDLVKTSDVPGLTVHSFKGLLNFIVTLRIGEGPYCGSEFHYAVCVTSDYPFVPPIVQCKNPPFHPQYDAEGNVGIFRDLQDWAPHSTLTRVFILLKSQFLTREGIMSDCDENTHNPEAFHLCANDWPAFLRRVRDL